MGMKGRGQMGMVYGVAIDRLMIVNKTLYGCGLPLTALLLMIAVFSGVTQFRPPLFQN